MKRLRRTSEREPTTALINIVFLILIFFMVAGSLTRPAERSLSMVETDGLDCCHPPNALVLLADGRFSYQGQDIATLDAYVDTLQSGERLARIAPDRALPAQDLMQAIERLQALGVDRITLITEDGGRA